MTAPDRTGALGDGWGRSGLLATLAAAVSLAAAPVACGRFGFDLLPRDDGSAGAAGRDNLPGAGAGGAAPDGGAGAGTSGEGGAQGGNGGSGGDGGHAGAPGEEDGGVGGSGGSTGGVAADAGGSAGSTSGTSGAGGSGALPLCSDGEQNGDELAVDCGGPDCLPCACAFAAPEVLANPNFAGNQLWSPSLSSDAQTLYLAVVVPGVNEQIAVATRPDRGNTFGFANALPAPVNQSVEGAPHISLDGLSLYFFSERAGSGPSARDLYVATRSSPNGSFDNATPLSTLNSSALDHLPWASGDELTVYFASQRSGDLDIWRATRDSRAQAFGTPSAVSELNSSADDNGMTLSQDQRTIIIASNRPNGAGGYDLYQALRADTGQTFSNPEPLGVLNTGAADTDPALSPDGGELFFISTRNGDSQIWRSLRSCP